MKRTHDLERLTLIACRSDATVLLTGPTGTGKSRLARQIHERSSRSARPFVVANLATLHEGTFESELFGHERGAFTGADQKRVGRLEQANGGTVFLDEIGDLSPRLQARLLEFLQSRTVTPVGGNREVKFDVRVIAATHKDLEKAVISGEFRADLYHRLRVLSLELPALIDRPEEFDGLMHGCLEELCREAGRKVLRISETVAQRLETYSWPGNIRELRNVLEYAVLASDGPEILDTDLPPWFNRDGAVAPEHTSAVLGVAEFPLTLDFQASISAFEKEYLQRALKRYRGRVNQTARQIGLNKTTLIRRMRVYGLCNSGQICDEMPQNEGIQAVMS